MRITYPPERTRLWNWCQRMDPMPGMGGLLAREARKIARCLALPYAERPGYREDWRPA